MELELCCCVETTQVVLLCCCVVVLLCCCVVVLCCVVLCCVVLCCVVLCCVVLCCVVLCGIHTFILCSLEKSQVHSEFRKLFNDHHDLLNRADTSASQVCLWCLFLTVSSSCFMIQAFVFAYFRTSLNPKIDCKSVEMLW